MNTKKLIIISGITGSIGQEVLRKYLLEENTRVYGISRKGALINEMDTLPDHHMIVNVDLCNANSIAEFIAKIPKQKYQSISYFHLVGEFKTEITPELAVQVENDTDADGIDDCVHALVVKTYINMTQLLLDVAKEIQCEFNGVSFGSLADEHNIDCFSSFRKSREIVKTFSKEMSEMHANANFYLFNTSTILAADEMLERPFIFATSVQPLYWITPAALIQKTIEYMNSEKGLVCKDIYIANPNFSSTYFHNEPTYKRRVKELYNKEI